MSKNIHHKSLLKNAISKYGDHNFYIETVCECSSLEDLNKKEVFFIKKFDSTNRDKGYNFTAGGEGGMPGGEKHPCFGMKFPKSKEWREAMRAKMIEKKHSVPEFAIDMAKEINSKKVRDKFGNTFSSLTEAAAKYGISHVSVRQIALGKTISRQGYDFSFLDGESERVKKDNLDLKRASEKPKKKKIVCVNTAVVFDSIVSAANILGISRRTICNMLKGRSKTAGGLIFEYAGDKKCQ